MTDREIISERILHLIAEISREIGILDEISYRNKQIRLDFEKFKKEYPDFTVEQIMLKLQDKYYLGLEQLTKIIYSKDEQIIEMTPKPKPKKHRRTEPRR